MRPTLPLALVLSGCCCILPPGNGPTEGAPATPDAPPSSAQHVPRTPPAGAIARTVHVVLEMPGSKPDGRAWDAGDGAPDPYVVIRQAGEVVATTERMQDVWDATWRIPAMLVPEQPFTVEILDRDLTLDDSVTELTIQPTVVDVEHAEWDGYLYVTLED